MLPNKLNGMRQNAFDKAVHCMQWSQLVMKLECGGGDGL